MFHGNHNDLSRTTQNMYVPVYCAKHAGRSTELSNGSLFLQYRTLQQGIRSPERIWKIEITVKTITLLSLQHIHHRFGEVKLLSHSTWKSLERSFVKSQRKLHSQGDFDTHLVTAFWAHPSMAFLAPPLNFSRADRGFLAGVAPSWLPRELLLLIGVCSACCANDFVNSSIWR